MPDSHDRSGDLAEHARDVGGVGGDATKRIDGGAYRDTGGLQPLDHAAPAGTIGEGAVNKDDGHGSVGGVRIGHDDSFLPSPEPTPKCRAATALIGMDGQRSLAGCTSPYAPPVSPTRRGWLPGRGANSSSTSARR